MQFLGLLQIDPELWARTEQMTEPQRCVTGHGTLTLEGLADSVSGYLDLPREFRCLTDRRFAPPLVNAEPLGLVSICVGLDPAHAERPIVHIHLFPSDGIESFERPGRTRSLDHVCADQSRLRPRCGPRGHVRGRHHRNQQESKQVALVPDFRKLGAGPIRLRRAR
jgi:hypothetical protein